MKCEERKTLILTTKERDVLNEARSIIIEMIDNLASSEYYSIHGCDYDYPKIDKVLDFLGDVEFYGNKPILVCEKD